MKSFESKYFDGTSSKPNDVSLHINKDTDQISFYFQNKQSNWNLKNNVLFTEEEYFTVENPETDEVILLKKNPDLDEYLYSFKNKSFYNNLLDAKIRIHLIVLAGIISLLVLSNKYILPTITEKVVVLIPTSIDTQIGEIYLNEFLEKNNIDSLKTTKLNQFTNLLNTDNQHKFYVINSKEINAFCLPDGTIIVYSEILNLLENENELIALLGHEITHYKNRHSIKTLARNLTSYLFISLLTTDITGISNLLIENSHLLQSLSFSRKFENEADKGGLEFLLKNKADPNSIVTLFEKLDSHSKINLPELLSTHPDSKKRASLLSKYISSNHLNSGVFNSRIHSAFLELKKGE